jgi:hypothetical protein
VWMAYFENVLKFPACRPIRTLHFDVKAKFRIVRE